MQRQLTSTTNLDNLRKEAKRWLKALRDNDTEARERFARANPKASGVPVLRDVQHALAREYGLENWTALRLALDKASLEITPDLVQRFLECACPDHHVRGLPAHEMARHAAMRILHGSPAIARQNLYTAVVCGEIEEAERILREHPELANTKHPASGRDRSGGGGNYDFLADFGAKDWEPLLYLCFTRLPLERANENAVRMARLLLEHGANPNAHFMAGDSRYTPLTGAAGEGEEGRPPHPRRDELARLLLEHGAEPYDTQVIYDINFEGKVLWWLKLMHEFSVKAGRGADWNDPEWHMLDQGGYGSGARWHLRTAIEHNDLELAEWCLAHGATPNPAPERDQRYPQQSLYERAVRKGRTELAELLVRHGAPRVDVQLTDEEQYVAACLRLDRESVGRILAQHPEYREATKAIFAATEQDRADVVKLLLDLGTPVNVHDPREQRPLHVAAANDAVEVARLLIERGAEIDPYELNYSNTPLDFAEYYQLERMIELLTPYSRDVWNLVRLGKVERLREVLSEEPRLAKVSWQNTPLFRLPEDEAQAVEIVKLFLEHGADAGFRNRKDGSTAGEVARKRGMLAAAELLESATDAAEDAPRDLAAEYEQLAQDLATVYQTDDEEALERLGRHFNRILSFDMVRERVRQRRERRGLTQTDTVDPAEARQLIAQQAGFDTWEAFLATLPGGAHYQAAHDYVNAYEGDAAALDRLNRHYQRSFSRGDLNSEIWGRVYAFRQRSSRVPKNYLRLDEAQMIVAQNAGFGSWKTLIQAAAAGAPPPGSAYVIDAKENRIGPRRRPRDADWEDLIAVSRERGITGVEANSFMTDAALERLAEAGHVTRLSLSGSRELTEKGLGALARMPQLERLDLSGCKVTDRALEVLRHLPNLRIFEMVWQSGISDAGVANLRFCDKLERVNLMGSATGDGAIEALAGKAALRDFSTGQLVTDAGLPLLHQFPLLKRWHGEEGFRLLLDGPFTNRGMAGLEGLEGLYNLDLFWNVTGITTDAYVHLLALPNLGVLGCDGELSNDTAMEFIGRIPRLRRVRAQESAATEEGFVALARSQSIESIWGRECPNFGSRGFLALSKMPALRGFGIGLQKVDEEALSALPSFPALRELTPIGLKDPGFRYVGQCHRLEKLTCMYCRETTDVATEHIARLELRDYYAGLTQITDRSLEILGGMKSLEEVEFYECKGVTDAGLRFLAALPKLREIRLSGLPGVTLEGTKVFPATVRVQYWT